MLVAVNLPPKDEEEESRARSLYVDDPLWNRMREIAQKEGYRSRNDLIVRVLRQFVETYDKRTP